MTRHEQLQQRAEPDVTVLPGAGLAPLAAAPSLGATGAPVPAADEVKDLINLALDDDQADEVLIIDLAGKTTIADFMIIASGRSSRHVAALAQNVCEKLRACGIRPPEPEGMSTCDWVVVDAGDVILHLFQPEVRLFYNLEKMWSLAPPPAEPVVVRMV